MLSFSEEKCPIFRQPIEETSPKAFRHSTPILRLGHKCSPKLSGMAAERSELESVLTFDHITLDRKQWMR